MMDHLTAELHLSKLLEAEGNSAQMEMVCRTALDWHQKLIDAYCQIGALKKQVRTEQQATLRFMA